MKIFVTGGTGLIGARFIRLLRQHDHQVVIVSRRADAWTRVGQDVAVVIGDPGVPGPWQERLAECDAVVNLAGENLFARRWSEDFKKQLLDSRVKATTNVADTLVKSPKRSDGTPKVLINGSAIGYYGPHGDEPIDESAPPGTDVLAKMCIEWEAAAKPAAEAGVRTVLLRTGIVLDKEGGALKTLLLPFQMGAGGPTGTGQQVMSWIHHADECGLMLHLLNTDAAHGPFNATAPNPVTNKEFGKALGAALKRPAFLPTPAFALKLLLGEVADVVLTGARVLPKKALASGYKFQFSEAAAALADILRV